MKLIYGNNEEFLKADACYFAIYGKIVSSVKVENDPGACYWRMLLYNEVTGRKYPILIFSKGIVPETWPLPVFVEGYVNVRTESCYLVARKIWDAVEVHPKGFSIHKWERLQFDLFLDVKNNVEVIPSTILESAREGLFGGLVKIPHADSAFEMRPGKKEEPIKDNAEDPSTQDTQVDLGESPDGQVNFDFQDKVEMREIAKEIKKEEIDNEVKSLSESSTY